MSDKAKNKPIERPWRKPGPTPVVTRGRDGKPKAIILKDGDKKGGRKK
jgi:hypothetical protein